MVATSRIPADRDSATLRVSGKPLELTNLRKLFWPPSERYPQGLTKGDVLRYYEAVSRHLVPHLRDRAMVMKRYPHGILGEHFFMKRTPAHRPDWIATCAIRHGSGNVIDFPMVNDLPSLLWIVNLGCIDLNPWYARCDDVRRPDYVTFDLDPVEGEPAVPWARILESALVLRTALEGLGMRPLVKTSGSRGLHVYVAIERGPTQKEVWRFAKRLAGVLAAERPDLLTAEYRIADRPPGRVLIDYNQNAWNRTLASIYSLRPRPAATVSTPLDWSEVEEGVAAQAFRIDTVPRRLAERGDLWTALRRQRSRFDLQPLLAA